MTTITAVSSTEVVVNNNGRAVRVEVAKLMAVDEQVASCVRAAVQVIGEPVTVPAGRVRKPRHATVHAILQ
jgi:hypothetical protein